MTDRDPALEPFDALIGTWATEATRPTVDAACVIGAPEVGDGLVMGYFDSRGVRRTYGISLGFEGPSQVADTPGDWQDDLKVVYRRASA